MIGFIYAIIHFLGTLRELIRDPEFKGLFGFVVIVLLTGTIFYSQVEGWSILDSLYFCTTTLTTVGLGDFYPVTQAGKAFTIIYIFIGVGIILAFVNALARHAKEKNPIVKLLKQDEK